MKPKKQSKPAPLKLTPSEVSAISCALDFLSQCDTYVYDSTKFDHRDVSKLVWSIEDSNAIENRKGIRIVIAAIDLSLHSLNTSSPELEQVSKDFPDLIPDLVSSLSVLETLRPRLVAHAAKQN